MDSFYGSMNFGIFGTSSDVLHSFSLLDFGVHTDCIPGKAVGHEVVSDVIVDEYITCQELCGYGHSGMSIFLNC
jgi:heme/copper-type cytochrome/quinol oxidase subunit 2